MKNHKLTIILAAAMLCVVVAGAIHYARYTGSELTPREDVGKAEADRERVYGPFKVEIVEPEEKPSQTVRTPDVPAPSESVPTKEEKISPDTVDEGVEEKSVDEGMPPDSDPEAREAESEPPQDDSPKPGSITITDMEEPKAAETNTPAEPEKPETVLPSSPDDGVRRLYVKNVAGNIREAPTMEAPIKFQLKQNIAVSVTGNQGNWYAIRMDDGREGWGHRNIFSEEPVPGVESPKEDRSDLKIIYAIRAVKTFENETQVIFELNGYHPPNISASQGDELGLVCEFEGARLGGPINPLNIVADDILEEIRVNITPESPENIRVELELVEGPDYSVSQVYFEKDNYFVIIIQKAIGAASANPKR
jgi:SH3-like domain-containing protein